MKEKTTTMTTNASSLRTTIQIKADLRRIYNKITSSKIEYNDMCDTHVIIGTIKSLPSEIQNSIISYIKNDLEVGMTEKTIKEFQEKTKKTYIEKQKSFPYRNVLLAFNS